MKTTFFSAVNGTSTLRRAALASGFALLALGTAASAAQAQEGSGAMVQATAQAIAQADSLAQIQREVAQAAQGDYRLADGRSLAVAGPAKHLRAPCCFGPSAHRPGRRPMAGCG